MADDDHDAASDLNENENDDGNELPDYDEVPTTPGALSNSTTSSSTSLSDDYADDEPIEDYVVNLVVNERPDIVSTFATDSYGNTLYNTLNEASTAVYDELNGNGTAIAGGKRWFGWSTTKLILVILIALCILGIILAAVFFVLSKKFKKNQRTATGAPGSTTTTKAVVTKGVSPDPKYQPVPNV